MIKDSPNPPSDSSSFHPAALQAISNYLNPSEKPDRPTDGDFLLAVREGLNTETILINASEDLASIQAIACNLAFQIDSTHAV
jgi:hypothetical protein